MAGFVLSDANPLIALSRVDGLAWLPSLFGQVWMPPEVRSEVLPGLGLPGEDAVALGLDSGWLRVTEPAPATPELPELDEGEAACIRIALAQSNAAPLLMDERAGQTIALEHGLRVAGTAAIIGLAKQRGLIPSARQAFAQLHAAKFRIAPEVIQTVLQRVGE
jgi:predicted nucleic acid-binding protein